ncbi:MAG: HAD family phosphatase [Lachnospiraceae bacterium]|nr:HAD family phosphatase [Lachnospiraceae bacterium]
MIKNLIFDMGNVLINYRPEHFMDRAGLTDAQDRETLLKEVFHSEEWIMADAGKITAADIFTLCSKRLPDRLHAVTRELILHWFEPLEPIPGMAEFIKQNKELGRGIYLLSNAPDTAHLYVDKVPGIEYFDGITISSDIRMEKPYADIFNYVCDKYGLVHEECLFIDDVQKNVDGAEAVGMHGYLFTGDIEDLWTYVN